MHIAFAKSFHTPLFILLFIHVC